MSENWETSNTWSNRAVPLLFRSLWGVWNLCCGAWTTNRTRHPCTQRHSRGRSGAVLRSRSSQTCAAKRHGTLVEYSISCFSFLFFSGRPHPPLERSRKPDWLANIFNALCQYVACTYKICWVEEVRMGSFFKSHSCTYWRYNLIRRSSDCRAPRQREWHLRSGGHKHGTGCPRKRPRWNHLGTLGWELTEKLQRH